MEKAIWKRFLVVLILSLFLCGSISGILIGNVIQENSQTEMIYSLRLVDYNLNYQEDLQEQLNALNDVTMTTDTRLTLMDLKGEVLADTSTAQAAELENHFDREEVTTALRNEEGFAIRYSATVMEQTMYACIRSQNGDYLLRLSLPYNPWKSYFRALFPALLLSIVISLIVAMVLAKKFSRSITEPLSEISAELSKIQNTDEPLLFRNYQYPELNRIASSTITLSNRIDRTMKKLRLERAKIDSILDNMSEGLILLDEQKRVLGINQSAQKILGCMGVQKESPLVDYTKNEQILAGMDECLQAGTRVSFDLQTEEHGIYQVHMTQIRGGDSVEKISGAIILFVDVTSERSVQQMREEFFSNISHELKTPITSIQGFAELLESGMVSDPATEKEFLSRIKKETGNMTGLINDILMISRLESNQAYQNPTLVRLEPMIRDIISTWEPVAKQNQISILCNCPNLSFRADAQHIHQLVNNLIGNAVKYNKPCGKVEIEAAASQKELTLVVSDTGIGIPQKDQQRVFERFYRVDKGRSRKMGGTGLGLSIVKHIVQFYHGQILLQSTPDVGTKITVTLPLPEQFSETDAPTAE